MESVRRFVAVILDVAIGLFTASLVTQSAGANEKKGLRGYYVTQDFHDGSEALTACAAGFHMASLWEIFDPSSLQYDTTLGFTSDDSGSGPSVARGWIRTGVGAQASEFSSLPNCNAWTSNLHADHGTEVNLAPTWESPATPTPISPWIKSTVTCAEIERVWCVED